MSLLQQSNATIHTYISTDCLFGPDSFTGTRPTRPLKRRFMHMKAPDENPSNFYVDSLISPSTRKILS